MRLRNLASELESCRASEFFAFVHCRLCMLCTLEALLSSGPIQVDCRSKQECGPVLRFRFLFFHRIESDDQRFEIELAECVVS